MLWKLAVVTMFSWNNGGAHSQTCDCSQMEFGNDCSCFASYDFAEISSLRNVTGLTIFSSNFTGIDGKMFGTNRRSIVDISLIDSENLVVIDYRTFSDFPLLQSIYISRAPSLTNLSLDILENGEARLKILRITGTGLTHLPYIRHEKFYMHMLDFEGNNLMVLKSDNLNVEADHAVFDYNKISAIEGWAFNRSRISKLSFKGNYDLRVISKDAFQGLSYLRILDLSETSIAAIPANGIDGLEILVVKNAYSMKIIPSIYDIQALKKAELTFSFHCCAFKMPQKHNPQRHLLHQLHLERMKITCENASMIVEGDDSWNGNSTELQKYQTEGTAKTSAICGMLKVREAVQCNPVPDAFNPCEDLLGYDWLRYCALIVATAGLVGNVCVLWQRKGNNSEITNQCFLMRNLAAADLCMIAYLAMIIGQDYISKGAYFNYAYDWQMGVGCDVAGFLSIFSSQLSIFTLCLLTMDRWFCVKRAMLSNIFTVGTVTSLTIFAWIYSAIMAFLPIFGVSSYSATSLCLPMKATSILDVVYILTLLTFNVTAFVVICGCYAQIYYSLNYETRSKGGGDYAMVKKIMVLVFANFACWGPVTFFAITALAGFPLVDVAKAKILLVFFYPINACANPFLYTILTANFKRQFVRAFSR